MSSIVLSIFILSIGASFIQRTTGFGFGIFIMTMLPGYHHFCCYRMAVKELRHLAATLADSADIYHCLNCCYFRTDSHRRPYLTTYSWRSAHSDQHLLHAV